MKTVGLLTRPKFKSGLEQARQILSLLEEKGFSVQMTSYLAKALNRPKLSTALADMKVDFTITLGGDGTTLYAARNLPPTVPILPVNLQSFGFLAECEIEEVQKTLDDVIANKLQVHETPRLASRYKKKHFPDAANEVSLFPLEKGRPVRITLQLGETSEFNFHADGLIIATPMGSTGHALSLGGPILGLDLEGFLLMPVAPLRFSFLPLIVPSSIDLQAQLEHSYQVIIDGDQVDELPGSGTIHVCQSKNPLRLLRRPSQFFTRLQRKLLRC